METFQCFSNVDTHPVLSSLIRRRKQTNQIKVKGTFIYALQKTPLLGYMRIHWGNGYTQLTEASNVSAKLLLELGASLEGVSSNSCSVHSSAVD